MVISKIHPSKFLVLYSSHTLLESMTLPPCTPSEPLCHLNEQNVLEVMLCDFPD